MRWRRLWHGAVMASLVLAGPAAAGARDGEGLPTSAEGVHPILVGTPAPDGALRTPEGRETTLHALLDGRPTVLVFYRGHW
jgi:hypothetical protein